MLCSTFGWGQLGLSTNPTTVQLLKDLVDDNEVVHHRFLSHHVVFTKDANGHLIEFEQGSTFYMNKVGHIRELHSGARPHWVEARQDDYTLLWSVFAIMLDRQQPTYPPGTYLHNDEHLPDPLCDEEMELVRGSCNCPER